MDSVSKILICGIAVTIGLIIVLISILIVAKQKEKKNGEVEVTDDDGEFVEEKEVKKQRKKKSKKSPKLNMQEPQEIPMDISNIELIDPAIQPLLDQAASFISDDTDGIKYEQFDTVAASEVARSIASVHEATGFNIIYTGTFTADTLMYKFYYLQVADKNAEDGFAYYVLYESGVGASAVFIGESKDEVNDVYLANKGGVNLC